jgi:hypothetical protein
MKTKKVILPDVEDDAVLVSDIPNTLHGIILCYNKEHHIIGFIGYDSYTGIFNFFNDIDVASSIKSSECVEEEEGEYPRELNNFLKTLKDEEIVDSFEVLEFDE